MVIQTVASEDANRPTPDANQVLISLSKYNVNRTCKPATLQNIWWSY